jgi:ribonuclease HI
MMDSNRAVAYVDGSYLHDIKIFSYGVVLFYQGHEYHFSEKFNTPEIVSMRNVAGEIKGAEKAMRFCLENGISEVEIFHDYEGIAKWCTGEWKANKFGTQSYRDFFLSLRGKLNVIFTKVRAHSGDIYNDMADRLARDALYMGGING